VHNIIYLIPFVGAFAGWLVNFLAIELLFHPITPKKFLGISFQGTIPKNQKKIANNLAKIISEGLKPLINEIEAKVTSSSSIDKMMPFIETHIDHFIRVKLAQKMPVISMFIGENTITELKTVFLEELQSLFPELIKNYIKGLREDVDLEAAITNKIDAFQLNNLEKIIKNNFGKQLTYLGIFSSVVGFMMGLIQLMLVLLPK